MPVREEQNSSLTFNKGPEGRLNSTERFSDSFYITNGSVHEYELYITDSESNLHKVQSLKWKEFGN